MDMRWRGSIILLSTLLITGYGIAHNTCSALIENAIESVAVACHGMSRNQVCYGNVSLDMTPTVNAPDFAFERVGDITDVSYIRRLKLAPLDEPKGVWGIAMMQLQADIPDTLPGQNVTFLVFGDVELENTASADQAPMQSFYLRTGVGDAACVDTPDSGLLIQTPDGVQSVEFNINGVAVEIGSTVLLQAKPDEEFVIRTLEGAAVVTMGGESYPVIAGTEMTIPVDAQMQPEGLPSLPVPLSERGLGNLPIAPLPQEISPPVPLSDTAAEVMYTQLDEGLAPCDVPGLPACEHALSKDENRKWAKKDKYTKSDKPDKSHSQETETDIIVPAPTEVIVTPIESAPITEPVTNPVIVETPVTTTDTSETPVVETSVPQDGPPAQPPGQEQKQENEQKNQDKEQGPAQGNGQGQGKKDKP
jgi:hypothetical protein